MPSAADQDGRNDKNPKEVVREFDIALNREGGRESARFFCRALGGRRAPWPNSIQGAKPISLRA